LISSVNSARDHLSRVPAILKRFRQAVLAAACSGRLTADWREKNLLPTDAASTDLIDPTATLDQLPEDIQLPQEWKVSTLDKLLTRVEAGKNIRCLEHPPAAGQKGIVKISAVTWGDFREDESKTLEDPTLFMPERAILAGDLLISRANTIELVGACVLVREIKRTLMLSDKVLRLQATDKWKAWLLICLRSPLGRFQIENLATGNQLSMRNITQDSLRRIVIPLPSPQERDETVRRVEELLGLADAIEKRIVATTSRCNKLTQSILAKAFRGELVPTEAELARREGREYEPASVLLERIRAERGAAATQPARRPRNGRKKTAKAGS
jgi:type I restriction enzyme S subunit